MSESIVRARVKQMVQVTTSQCVTHLCLSTSYLQLTPASYQAAIRDHLDPKGLQAKPTQTLPPHFLSVCPDIKGHIPAWTSNYTRNSIDSQSSILANHLTSDFMKSLHIETLFVSVCNLP